MTAGRTRSALGGALMLSMTDVGSARRGSPVELRQVRCPALRRLPPRRLRAARRPDGPHELVLAAPAQPGPRPLPEPAPPLDPLRRPTLRLPGRQCGTGRQIPLTQTHPTPFGPLVRRRQVNGVHQAIRGATPDRTAPTGGSVGGPPTAAVMPLTARAASACRKLTRPAARRRHRRGHWAHYRQIAVRTRLYGRNPQRHPSERPHRSTLTVPDLNPRGAAVVLIDHQPKAESRRRTGTGASSVFKAQHPAQETARRRRDHPFEPACRNRPRYAGTRCSCRTARYPFGHREYHERGSANIGEAAPARTEHPGGRGVGGWRWGQVAVNDRSAVTAPPGSRVTSLDAERWPTAEAVIRSGPGRASSQRS